MTTIETEKLAVGSRMRWKNHDSRMAARAVGDCVIVVDYDRMIEYLMGDKSQPMHIDQGLVIGHNWNIRDGSGALYAGTPDETKARAILARLKVNQPRTDWTLSYDCR